MAEVVKRLAPTGEVLRELFLKSGNLCAFPSCSASIMDKEGHFIAEVCHIEAAEEGGERFNKGMTNEERRAFSNLVLLCHQHHVVTNDVVNWPVKRMQEMKANHERKVFEFIENLQLRIVDFTSITAAKPATSLSRLAKVQNWSLEPDEIAASATELNLFLDRLRKVPPPARKLLAISLEKAALSGMYRNCVSLHELQHACALNEKTLSELVQILDKYGFIDYAGEDDYGHPQVRLKNLGCGWPVWDDFRDFTKAGQATLHELIVDLNFSLLD